MKVSKTGVPASEATTSLSAWGTSRAVRIPKKMCEQANLAIGSKLKISFEEDAEGLYLSIRPAEYHRSFGEAPYVPIDELFAGYQGDCETTEFDWGADVGEEIIA